MKIIASDYDGTLNYHGVDDAKRAAIARWRKAGNRFGLVSGRGMDALPDILSHDRFECDFFIANNGALIAAPDGTVLAESRCDGSIAIPLLKVLFDLGCPWGSISTEPPFVVRATPSARHPKDYTLENAPKISHFNQISTILPTFEEAARVTAAIKERFGQWVNPLQNGVCIDIVPAGMDKAQGLYRLLSLWNASYDDLITVGDNINDTAMIAEFRSYAMENAVPSILALADAVTPGITELIELELSVSALE